MPRRTDNRSTISAFASTDLVDRLYRYSQRHGITKSEAVRRLIAFGLDCEAEHVALLPPSALGAGAPTDHPAASTTTPSSGGSGSEEPRVCCICGESMLPSWPGDVPCPVCRSMDAPGVKP